MIRKCSIEFNNNKQKYKTELNYKLKKKLCLQGRIIHHAKEAIALGPNF